MGISRLGGSGSGGGIDWREFSEVQRHLDSFNLPAGATTTYTTAYSIAGSGFIDSFLYLQSNGNTGGNDLEVHIFVDGEIIQQANTSYRVFKGILSSAIKDGNTVDGYEIFQPGPYNSPTSQTYLAARPIYFAKSFEVKVRRLTANTPPLYYSIQAALG